MSADTPTYKKLEAAAKKLGERYGFHGQTGGWIYRNGEAVNQGWWNMGAWFMGRGLISGNHRTGYTIDWAAAEARYGSPSEPAQAEEPQGETAEPPMSQAAEHATNSATISNDVTTVPAVGGAQIFRRGSGEKGLQPVEVRFFGLDGVGVEVRVHPHGPAVSQELVDALAALVAVAVPEAQHYIADRDEAHECARRAHSRQLAAEERVAYLTGAKVRTMGRARVRTDPHHAGMVWLLDPGKGWDGFGYSFPSLDDLWRQMPDLRPVAWGEDEDGPWMDVESRPVTPG